MRLFYAVWGCTLPNGATPIYTEIMFTGIAEKTLSVAEIEDHAKGRRLSLFTDWQDLQLGQSVAVNGCCLTIAEFNSGVIRFDVVKETLDRTNLGSLRIGDRVNVERALRIGDRLDGHWVQGHIDGTAVLLDSKSSAEETRLRLRAAAEMAKYLIPKGSVSLDGVSLTIASVWGDIFEVALIPTTLQKTTLGAKSAGWAFNFEADILAKTIVNWLERMSPGLDLPGLRGR
jgi:riboflavin synthase